MPRPLAGHGLPGELDGDRARLPGYGGVFAVLTRLQRFEGWTMANTLNFLG
jgi:hypothetical protein